MKTNAASSKTKAPLDAAEVCPWNPVARVTLLLISTFFFAKPSSAQISTVIFQDDFAANTIDPAKYQPDAPFFEGGIGDVHAVAENGVMRFVGTTTQQWWSGATLRVVPVFTATEQANLVVSVDRVAEAGLGSASRSALWILDETRTKYVLFADVRGEGGWRFNRKTGEAGDVPTGSGTDIAVFNGGTFDDGLLHRMKMVADGRTVKLFLDDQLGTEVSFPFSKVIVEFGSYARANNDTADTTWDNLRIERAQQTRVVFMDDFASDTIDPAKYQPDAPFFEGGVGDIHAEAGNGVIRFVGTTTQQWWSGATLRVVPTFTASQATPVMASIDRVAEAGVGSASRSAFWILDETRTKYVLFADVRGEGGWRYNRKIGEAGDVPTGSGTDIAAFNGGTFDDGTLRRMSIIADGQNVKLLLDGQVGAEVRFPFSRITFQFGSYARANNDTANTTFDNIKIETAVGAGERCVFTDDFSSNTIDPAEYVPDSPFFEGGVGDVHAVAENGVMRFVGTTTQQWWSGSVLRIVPTFEASDGARVTLSIKRVAEAGVGSASRSALWIFDETRTKYVLFADVRAEGGWRYNRKIGETGDVPTGSGTDIAAFNGGTFDNGAEHVMSIVADGATVKLLLDGIEGADVPFPFSPVSFAFGSYARANNDTADTTWDDLQICTFGSAAFSPAAVTVRNGGTSSQISVRIPQGLNAQSPIQIRVTSSDPSIAVPEGGAGGSLDLTFPAGGPNTVTFRVRGVALGAAQFSADGDVASLNPLAVAVVGGPAVLLQDSFAGAVIDSSRWQTSNVPFETGTGDFQIFANFDDQLEINGTINSDFWAGASLKTTNSYLANRDLPLSFEMERVLMEQVGTAGRSGVFITTADRSRFVYFGQNTENNWQVNVNPGNPTGGGTRLTVFDDVTDLGSHVLKLVADGETVEVFLDGRSGGRFPFAVTSGIFFEIGAFGRAAADTVRAVFDNVKIENVLPCITASPQAITITAAERNTQATVSIPALLNDAAAATVTITSRDPAIAHPEGAVNGVLVLNFPAGTSSSRSFNIIPVRSGATVFDIVSSPQVCVAGSIAVDVIDVPLVLLTDDFSGTEFDTLKWRLDMTPFENGSVTAGSAVTLTNGQAKIDVTVGTPLWPGLALFTVPEFSASGTSPVSFEIDRTRLDFVLTTGTDAEQRAGMWIKEFGGSFVFFDDHVAHNGRNFGWRYNKMTGALNDNPTGDGVNIAAFDPPRFNDQLNHRMKMVANGSTVKLYLDDVFGVEIPFAFSQNLVFGFGAYADELGNVTRGYFDNARITGGSAPRLSVARQAANAVITWSGPGTLQFSDNLSTWSDVTPAPVGNTLSVPLTQGTMRIYRLRP